MNTPSQRKRLPVNPSIEHLQRQAKRLTKQNPALKLAAAQHRLAQEYGCRNWAELARTVEAMGTNAKDLTPKETYNPLPDAANNGDIERVRRILATEKFTQHDLDLGLGRATCTLSQHPERRPLAELLLAHGADPDGQYGSNYGPIVMAACECLDAEGLAFLIDAGADVSFSPYRNKWGDHNSPLNMVAGTYVRGRNPSKHRCIDLLIQHGAKGKDDVFAAIHRGDAVRLTHWLRKDPSLIHGRFGPLPDSYMYGNIELRGASLLHFALEFAERACADALLDLGADINARADVIEGVGGQTPIFHAIATWDENPAMLAHMLRHVGPRADMKVRATFRLFSEVIQPPVTPLEYALRNVDETKASATKRHELELLRRAESA